MLAYPSNFLGVKLTLQNLPVYCTSPFRILTLAISFPLKRCKRDIPALGPNPNNSQTSILPPEIGGGNTPRTCHVPPSSFFVLISFSMKALHTVTVTPIDL
eukprot:TRINITY_DN21750_c0_g1_i1.p2 TRINITY_DN21750_c0_g1~~TRINITY_DN21750_c0_g1_i1.p2  ORF type:complete len:101 (-),score=0.44 TRINITY_DN21750_c0_g1_i1:141-443(-)